MGKGEEEADSSASAQTEGGGGEVFHPTPHLQIILYVTNTTLL